MVPVSGPALFLRVDTACRTFSNAHTLLVNVPLHTRYVPKHAAKLAPGVSLDPMCIDGVHTQKRVDSTEHRYTVILR